MMVSQERFKRPGSLALLGWQSCPIGRPARNGFVPGMEYCAAGYLPKVVLVGQKHMAMSSSHTPAQRSVIPPLE